MIAKFITSKSSARARHYAWVLMTYFTDPDPRKQIDANGRELALTLATYVKGDKLMDESAHRVLFTGAAISGATADWADGAEEMERRLAKRNRRIKKPVRHAVVSFRAGENPTQTQCREAVELMTEELGCAAGVALWSVHGDTDNVHIHMIHIPIDANGERLPYGRAVAGIAPDANGKLPKFAQEGQHK